MPDLSEYSVSILAYIAHSANARVSSAELESCFGHARMNDLLLKKLIEPADYASDPERPLHASAWRLTIAGQDALKARQDAVDQERRAKAEKDREKISDDVNASVKEKKSYRNNLKVAAFTVVLTLFFGHLPEIFQFIQRAIKAIRMLFE